jgi:hypothetical protein
MQMISSRLVGRFKFKVDSPPSLGTYPGGAKTRSLPDTVTSTAMSFVFTARAVANPGRAPLASVFSLIRASTRILGFELMARGTAAIVSHTTNPALVVIKLATKITGRIDNRDGSAEDDKRRELHDDD